MLPSFQFGAGRRRPSRYLVSLALVAVAAILFIPFAETQIDAAEGGCGRYVPRPEDVHTVTNQGTLQLGNASCSTALVYLESPTLPRQLLGTLYGGGFMPATALPPERLCVEYSTVSAGCYSGPLPLPGGALQKAPYFIVNIPVDNTLKTNIRLKIQLHEATRFKVRVPTRSAVFGVRG